MLRSHAPMWGFVLALASPVAIALSPLFSSEPSQAEPLPLVINAPIATLQRAKVGETPSVPATLQLEDGQVFDLKIRPRGKSRRAQCKFPPLQLNFKKSQVTGTVFEGQNKLKLVTHCAKKYSSREYLAREMLIYKLLNVLTPHSFSVRAVQVTYTDTQRGPKGQFYGFLIEHKNSLAQRMDGELLEVESLALGELNARYAALMGVFQYMIGNTDFSLRRGPADDCCHNAVPIETEQGVLTVPYDFDASGVVNAPYAAPAPNLSIRRVNQRLYRGYCGHNELVPEVVSQILAKQEELQSVTRTFSAIPGVKATQAEKYMMRFFDQVSTDAGIKKMLKRCR